MKSLIKLFKKLKYYFSQKDFVFNDPVPTGHLDNSMISDAIFDNNLVLFNCGYSKRFHDFIVIITTYQRELK